MRASRKRREVTQMSRKILTVLAPVFAIVAFMAIPTMAQAVVDQVQCGTVECANGATLKGQSSNLKTQVQTGATDEGELKCTSSTFTATLAEAQSSKQFEENKENLQEVQAEVTADTLTGCTAKGVTADVKTNASATHPWHLRAQVNHTTGQVTVHIFPNAQQTKVQFTVQPQVLGFSAATCTYGANSVQTMGTTQNDVATVEGNEQFLLEASNSSECGTVNTTKGDLSGSFQLENGAGEAVVVHSV
jgi:hypothetical protein